MNVLISPNAFKGNLNAQQVAEALSEGLLRANPKLKATLLPIADGGEGTVDILIDATGGTRVEAKTTNAIGEPIRAHYGIMPDGNTAFLELAAASGLGQLSLEQRSPMKASTYGTGLLIKDALDRGCRRIVLGLGGSATTDVGTGILRALGIKFLNVSGFEVTDGGGGFAFLETIDISQLDPRVKECEFILPCDVRNPLLGTEGSAAVFSPQKGATPAQVEQLEENITHFVNLVKKTVQKDIGDMPHGGAAGGTAAGIFAFLNARVTSGIDFLLEQIDFDQNLEKADILITAEGRLDSQSLEGKGPYGVARRAAARNIPAICVTGGFEVGLEHKLEDVFHAIFAIPTEPMSLESAKENAHELVAFTGWQIGKMLLLK
ncbi:MAG: glycerate kinase [Bacteroidia bacterium]